MEINKKVFIILTVFIVLILTIILFKREGKKSDDSKLSISGDFNTISEDSVISDWERNDIEKIF